jgi:REP element-mobilizing transposase RayT
MPRTSYPQRRHSRLTGYDYTVAGSYFVTVCTHHRIPLFGMVAETRMHLSPSGRMVEAAWNDILSRHAGIGLDLLAVLPDHLHAIVVLEDDPARVLSLSDMLHHYKSLTTRRYAQGVRSHGWPRFAGKLWQEGFYDRVIRDEGELDAVRRYVQENVVRWELRHAERDQGEEGRDGERHLWGDR